MERDKELRPDRRLSLQSATADFAAVRPSRRDFNRRPARPDGMPLLMDQTPFMAAIPARAAIRLTSRPLRGIFVLSPRRHPAPPAPEQPHTATNHAHPHPAATRSEEHTSELQSRR